MFAKENIGWGNFYYTSSSISCYRGSQLKTVHIQYEASKIIQSVQELFKDFHSTILGKLRKMKSNHDKNAHCPPFFMEVLTHFNGPVSTMRTVLTIVICVPMYKVTVRTVRYQVLFRADPAMNGDK